mmetsp:Transcript_23640/g.41897  ORF Transcript_23640/g.41897 Transcript_23640/m.41897 type:complete len:424 (-) Transcript_23640:82-1353(-)
MGAVNNMETRLTTKLSRSHHRTSSLHDSGALKEPAKIESTGKSKLQVAAQRATQTISTASGRLNKVLNDSSKAQSRSLLSKPSISIARKLKTPEIPSIQLAHKRTFSSLERPKTVKHKRRLTQEDPMLDSSSRALKKVLCASSASVEGYCESMPGKSNQDCVVECQEVCPNLWFAAVCDGHGVVGGEIARFVANRLLDILRVQQGLQDEPKGSLVKAIETVTCQLFDSDLDYRFSGTTLVALIMTPKEVICANVGDSRAFLGGVLETRNHSFHVPLSRDHKPELPEEADRIKKAGGRIEPYKDEHGLPLGPHRVWLKLLQIPGLAMSRSIGDSVARTVGVSSEPEVIVHAWRSQDNFVVLGSDGLFEFLPNETITHMLKSSLATQDFSGASHVLAKEARTRWEEEEETIDDISVTVVFLKTQV